MTDRRARLVAGGGADVGRVLEELDRPVIEVVLPDGTPTWRHQVVAVVFVDLLARLFPNVAVVVDASATADRRLPPGPVLLVDRLEAARSRGGLFRLREGEPDLRVRIGPGDGADLYIDAGSWMTYVGTEPSMLVVRDDEHLAAPGPVAAGARGAAAVFRKLLAHVVPVPPDPPSTYASVLSYRADTEPFIEEPAPKPGPVDVVFAGVGSVGGAAVVTFALQPDLSGVVELVDPQTLEDHNTDRALLVDHAAANAGLVKVTVAENAFDHLPGLDVRAHQVTLHDFVAARARDAVLPLVLCSVDSVEARRDVQDCLPLDLVNAACSEHEVQVSGHRTGSGPCVYCLHVGAVVDGSAILEVLIAEATGLPLATVQNLVEGNVALRRQHLDVVETTQKVADGSYDRYLGRSVLDLWHGELVYGGVQARTDSGGVVVVAAPFVTALAGALLAGEALKRAMGADSAEMCLGPSGEQSRYAENPYTSPLYAQKTSPERWDGSECLCRSTRRLRLMAERYNLRLVDGNLT